MKKRLGEILFVTLLALFLSNVGYSQNNQKLAQTGFGFLSVVSDARASAMADAMTSLQFGSSALFFNPAGMTEVDNVVDMSASINQWIADIKHNTFSVAVKPAHGDYGVIGFSAQSVDYGQFYGTRVNKSDPKGYTDVGIFNLGAIAIGVGYAKELTDQFSVGGQMRWAHQNLGESAIPNKTQQVPVLDSAGHATGAFVDSSVTVSNRLNPLVFDFGTQFKTGFNSLVFGMSVRNFSKEIQYVWEGFQLPLVFSLGISMNLLDFVGTVPMDQSLYMSIDASHYRDHPEQVKIGMEYRIMKMLSLRGGYVTNSDESGLSYGVGVSQYGFAFDYSYTPFGVFDKVQRVTARFSM